MPSKPGRPPVSTSFKKGNTAALGNDKSTRLSTLIDKALDKQLKDLNPNTMEGYDALMQAREMLATKLVKKAIMTKDDATFKSYFSEIADRTEGKALQRTDVTSDGEKMSVLFVKPDKMED